MCPLVLCISFQICCEQDVKTSLTAAKTDLTIVSVIENVKLHHTVLWGMWSVYYSVTCILCLAKMLFKLCKFDGERAGRGKKKKREPSGSN